jgi:hypothetical protein
MSAGYKNSNRFRKGWNTRDMVAWFNKEGDYIQAERKSFGFGSRKHYWEVSRNMVGVVQNKPSKKAALKFVRGLI